MHCLWILGLGLKALGFRFRVTVSVQASSDFVSRFEALPVTDKIYRFKELYIETIVRNPKKVGHFGYRYTLRTVFSFSSGTLP